MQPLDADRYYTLEEQLAEFKLVAQPGEIHGVIAGLICAGAGDEPGKWRTLLHDLVNEGHAFSSPLSEDVADLYQDTLQTLVSEELELQLLMPADDESLQERAAALTEWASGFLTGFGAVVEGFDKTSDELKEMLRDVAEIARLGVSEEDEDDDELANEFEHLIEYVRITALNAYAEIGQHNAPRKAARDPLH